MDDPSMPHEPHGALTGIGRYLDRGAPGRLDAGHRPHPPTGARMSDPGARSARAGVSAHASTSTRLRLHTDAPGAARAFVDQCLGTVVDPGVLADAKLLVSELVSNSVRHSGCAADGRVEVGIEIRGTTFRIAVEDPGVGRAVAPRPPDLVRGGGFGLGLIETLGDRWGVEPSLAGGTCVWVDVSCHPTVCD